ncbi:MAG: VanZ family protein, partial [Bdellovibrionales bacterium]|nr:VanZ family protein [Bdellovibrionales bacterium]
ALLLGIRNLGKLNERHSLRQHFHPSSRLLFLGLGGALLIVVVCEAMIVLPIERIHFLKYGLLALCIFLSFPRLSKTRRFALSTLLTSLVGCAEESLQILVPDRFFDWRDIAINVLAAALGASYACLLHAQTGVAEDSERRVGGH